jgi:hypothetical protein
MISQQAISNLIYFSFNGIHLFLEDWTEVAARSGGPQV